MNNNHLLIFDCDGVLVDSEIITTQHFIQQLEDLGCHISMEDSIKRFTGKAAKTIYQEISDEQGIYLSQEMIDEMQRKIHEALHHQVSAIRGIAELLENLKKYHQFCVASSGSMEKIEKSLAKTKLKEHFDPHHLFSAQYVNKGKPAPDLFLYAAAKMGYDPSQCIVIEDSPAGIEAALAASMSVIGFLGGSHTSYDWYQEKIKSYHIPIAYSSEDIAQILKNWKDQTPILNKF